MKQKDEQPQFPIFPTSCCLSPVVFTTEEVRSYLQMKKRCQATIGEATSAELLDRLHYRVYGRSSESGVKWKDMGFQGNNPLTDFRSGGLVASECLLYFTEKYGKETTEMVDPSNEFLLAATSINCTFFLKQYLHLGKGDSQELCDQDAFKRFLMLLTQSSSAFEQLSALLLIRLFYCHWLSNLRNKKHTLLDFNTSLKQATNHFSSTFNKRFTTLQQFSYLYRRQ